MTSDERRTKRLDLSRRTATFGLVGGVVHLLLVTAVLAWLGRVERLAVYFFTPDATIVFWAYATLLGAFLVGFVPVVVLLRDRLVVPAVFVGATFLYAVYGTWAALQPGPAWVGPLPITGYLLLWFVVLPAALLAGGVERAVRRIGPRMVRDLRGR